MLVDLVVVSVDEEGVEVEVPEVVVSVLEVLETTGVDPEAWAGLMTVKKMMTKTMARMRRTIPTMIPMTRGLLVAQRVASLAERGTSGACI